MWLFLPFLVAFLLSGAVDASRLLGYTFPNSQCTARTISELGGSGINLLLQPSVTCGNLGGVGGITVPTCPGVSSVAVGQTFASYQAYPLPSTISVEVWFSLNVAVPPPHNSTYVFAEIVVPGGSFLPISTQPGFVHLSFSLQHGPGFGGGEEITILQMTVATLMYPGGECEEQYVQSLFQVESTSGFDAAIQSTVALTGTMFKLVVASNTGGVGQVFIRAGGGAIEFADVYLRTAFLPSLVLRTVPARPADSLNVGCSRGPLATFARENMMIHKLAVYDEALTLAQVQTLFV